MNRQFQDAPPEGRNLGPQVITGDHVDNGGYSPRDWARSPLVNRSEQRWVPVPRGSGKGVNISCIRDPRSPWQHAGTSRAAGEGICAIRRGGVAKTTRVLTDS